MCPVISKDAFLGKATSSAANVCRREKMVDFAQFENGTQGPLAILRDLSKCTISDAVNADRPGIYRPSRRRNGGRICKDRSVSIVRATDSE